MSDARSLLKSKRQEARVVHPLAVYTTSGQLRCVACGTNVKHASSWEGHIGSKAHRVNTARLREEQQGQAEEVGANGKRKAEARETRDEFAIKKPKLNSVDNQPFPVAAAATTFPTDFFSDPSKTPLSLDSDEEEAHVPSNFPGPTATNETSTDDDEWKDFQQAVLNAPDIREAYERATVSAVPVLTSDAAEGFPPLHDENSQPEIGRPAMTAEESRRLKEQEDRELIMDRLLEEERAQEEADAKVSLLKQRLEILRRQRQVVRVAKTKTAS